MRIIEKIIFTISSFLFAYFLLLCPVWQRNAGTLMGWSLVEHKLQSSFVRELLLYKCVVFGFVGFGRAGIWHEKIWNADNSKRNIIQLDYSSSLYWVIIEIVSNSFRAVFHCWQEFAGITRLLWVIACAAWFANLRLLPKNTRVAVLELIFRTNRNHFYFRLRYFSPAGDTANRPNGKKN